MDILYNRFCEKMLREKGSRFFENYSVMRLILFVPKSRILVLNVDM